MKRLTRVGSISDISDATQTYIHGDSIKTKPNWLCHIYLIPDHIILKLFRYSEYWTNNMIPTFHNILEYMRAPRFWNPCCICIFCPVTFCLLIYCGELFCYINFWCFLKLVWRVQTTLTFSVTGQNGIGQNGTDKVVAIFIHSNSTELNFYSVATSHK